MTQAALDLRRLLERRFPDALPVRYGTTASAPTGVAELDAILPSGGLPRGKLTVWTRGPASSALLRAACRAAVERGERAAWVDGAGRIAGDAWSEGPLLLRPAGVAEAIECTEILLRSGGFAVVGLAGVRVEERAQVRLSRAAREGGAALVLVTGTPRAGPERPPSTAAALRISSSARSHDYLWRGGPFGPAQADRVTVTLRARALGLDARTDLSLSIENPHVRLSLDPGLPDRRGAPAPAF